MVAQRGQHTAVQIAERVEQLVADRHLGAHPARPRLGDPDAEVPGHAFILFVRTYEAVGDALVIGLELRHAAGP